MGEIHKIGDVDNADAKVVRIVHISDTHMQHDSFVSHIPEGDILIHSGDFGSYDFTRHFSKNNDFEREIQHIDTFFGKLPHKYKIFVAGNHETNFPQQNPRKTQRLLKNGIYLQDSFVIIEGVKIYGSPWNNYRMYSFARSFSLSDSQLQRKWTQVPDDTDILVTHLPPNGIMDLASVSAWKKLWRRDGYCDTCKDIHPDGSFILEHWGCPNLKEVVFTKRIKAHLFGHVHGCNGVEIHQNTLFSNAAMKCKPQVNVINYYVSNTITTSIEPEYIRPYGRVHVCAIM